MDETVTKTIQVIGLGSTEHESARHFANEIGEEHDLFEMTDKTKKEYLFYDGDDIVNIDIRLHRSLEKHDLGHFTETETYEVEEKKWPTTKPVKWDLKCLVRDLFTDHPELQKGILSNIEIAETGETVMSPNVKVKETQVPKPLDEQEPDSVFVEDSEEMPAVVFRVSLKDCPVKFATAANHILPEMMAEMLIDYEPVERIRYVNCFKEQKETFTCPRV